MVGRLGPHIGRFALEHSPTIVESFVHRFQRRIDVVKEPVIRSSRLRSLASYARRAI